MAGLGVGDLFEQQRETGADALVELTDGRLLIVTPRLQACYSADRGRSWTDPVPLIPGEPPAERSFDAVGLLRLRSGRLTLTYSPYPHPREERPWFPERALVFRTSPDDGATWSPARQINPPGAHAVNYHNALIQLRSGRLVLPVRWCFAGEHPELKGRGGYGWIRGERIHVEGHGHLPEMDIAFAYLSDDEGATWFRSRGEIMGWFADGNNRVTPCDEPTAVELSDGRVLMFCRSTIGRIVRSVSADGGITWSLAEPTDLASSYSPARLRRIPTTGDLLLLWNQVSGDEIRRGYRRGRLSSAVSRDDGATWEHVKTLETCLPRDTARRVAPDPELRPVRAMDDCGDLPEPFEVYHYPDAQLIGGEAFLLYSVGRPDPDPKRSSNYRKLRIVPIDWLYSA